MTSPSKPPPSLHPSREAEFPKVKRSWSNERSNKGTDVHSRKQKVKDAAGKDGGGSKEEEGISA